MIEKNFNLKPHLDTIDVPVPIGAHIARVLLVRVVEVALQIQNLFNLKKITPSPTAPNRGY